MHGSTLGLFHFDGVLYNTGRVFVVKGEIAAMVLLFHGLLACAPTGGEGMRMTQSIIKASALADALVMGDNDPDPRVSEETSRPAYERSKELNAKLFFPPKEYKDVDEWVLNDPFAIDKLRSLW